MLYWENLTPERLREVIHELYLSALGRQELAKAVDRVVMRAHPAEAPYVPFAVAVNEIAKAMRNNHDEDLSDADEAVRQDAMRVLIDALLVQP